MQLFRFLFFCVIVFELGDWFYFDAISVCLACAIVSQLASSTWRQCTLYRQFTVMLNCKKNKMLKIAINLLSLVFIKCLISFLIKHYIITLSFVFILSFRFLFCLGAAISCTLHYLIDSSKNIFTLLFDSMYPLYMTVHPVTLIGYHFNYISLPIIILL